MVMEEEAPTHEVKADMKTTPTGRPSLMSVGLVNTGPKPCALATAQENRVIPKMGCSGESQDGELET